MSIKGPGKKGASRPTKSSKSKETDAPEEMSADKMAKYQAMYDAKQKAEEEKKSNL